MKQKCPECKSWCVATEKPFIKRGQDHLEEGNRELDKFGAKFGPLGELASGMVKVVTLPQRILESGLLASSSNYYEFKCTCNHKWTTNSESEDQTAIYEEEEKGRRLAEDVPKRGGEPQFISLLENSFQQIEDKRVRALLCNAMAYVYYHFKNDTEQALEKLDSSLKLCDDPATLALKGLIHKECRTAEDYYKRLQELVNFKKPTHLNLIVERSEFEKETQDALLSYAENFLNIPPQKRRFLVINTELDVLPNSFKVLPLDQLPRDLVFPEGGPTEKKIYMCHPHKEKHYLPLEGFEDFLWKDQMREYEQFLQALGAKSVEIERLDQKEAASSSKVDVGGKVGGQYKEIGGSVGGRMVNDQSSNGKDSKGFLRKEYYEKGVVPPYVADTLKWYEHQSEWKTLAAKRMNGQISYEHKESISMEAFADKNDLYQVNVDFNALVASGSVSGSYSKSQQSKECRVQNFQIKVEFYPLSEYQREDSKTPLRIRGERPSHHGSKVAYGVVAIIIILVSIIGFLLL